MSTPRRLPLIVLCLALAAVAGVGGWVVFQSLTTRSQTPPAAKPEVSTAQSVALDRGAAGEAGEMEAESATTPATPVQDKPRLGTLQEIIDRNGVTTSTLPLHFFEQIYRLRRRTVNAICPEFRVSGRVTVQGTGEPVPGARVTWFPSGYGRFEGAVSTVTAEDGTYEWLLDGAETHLERTELSVFPPPGYFIPGMHARLSRKIDMADCEGTADFELARGSGVRGRVLEPDGVTAALDAEVQIRYPGDVMERYESGRTDAEGRFQFGLPADVPAYVSIKHALGHESRKIKSPALDQVPEEETFILTSEAAIRGRVLGLEGQPAAKVFLQAHKLTASASGAGLRYVASGRSDEEGVFFIEDLPAETPLEVRIAFASVPEGLGNAAAPEPLSLILEPGEVREGLVIQMVDGDIATGRVFDEESGEPIEGASVNLNINKWPGTNREVKSGPDGRFTIGNLPVGHTYKVSAGLQGYDSTRYLFDWSPLAGELELPMRRVLSKGVRFRVVDEQGEPVKYFSMGFGEDFGTQDQGNGRNIGFFTWEPKNEAESKEPRTISVRALNPDGTPAGLYGSTEVFFDDVNDSPFTVDTTVVVEPRDLGTGRIQGQVRLRKNWRDQDLEPLAGAEVFFVRGPNSEITGKPTPPPLFNPPAVKVKKDETAEASLIVRERVSLSGQIIGEDGRPVANAGVLAWSDLGSNIPSYDPPTARTTTDGEGRYRFDNLPPQNGYLQVDAPGFGDQRFEYKTRDDKPNVLDIDLSGRRRFAGQLRFTGDADLLARRIHFERPDWRERNYDQKTPVGVDGTFEVALTPGTYRLHLQGNNGIKVFTGKMLEIGPETPEPLVIECPLYRATVIGLPRADGQIPSGTLEFQMEGAGREWEDGYWTRGLQGERLATLDALPAGRVRLRQSVYEDGERQGDITSGWQTVGPGEENTFVLDFGQPPAKD
ncbi:MAG: carboxypeptidase-like regulatory domain-containing protein [Sumerlaeia bacterium]